MSSTLVMIILFLVLTAIGLPITFAVGIATAVAVVMIDGGPAQTVPLMMYTALNSSVLTAVPFFLLTGLLMERSRMADEIFNFARSLVGWARGGLGYVNVLASFMFGGTSGSAAADAAGLGRMEIKAMVRQGYPLPYTAAVTMTSSILSAIVPPSVVMIVYAQTAGVSASDMLISGIGPALLFMVAMMTVNWITAYGRGWKKDEAFLIGSVARTGRRAVWPLGAPILIIGCIYSGFATPTEAGFLAAFYAAVVATCVYRTISFSALPAILLEAGKATGVVLFILATGAAAGRVMGAEGIPQIVASYLGSLSLGPTGTLFVIMGFMILLGCVLEALAAVVILTPIFLPLAMSVGIDPVHFGVILISTLCLGLITPPVGVCLFIISSVAEIPLHRLAIAAIPFFLSLTIALILIVFFPSISLFLVE